MTPPQTKPTGLTYKDSGVDITAGEDFVARIRHNIRQTYGPNVIELPNGYAGLFALNVDGLFTKTYRKPILVSTTDGVGTKLKIAFMTGKHDTVGIDLVAMNVNDLVCVGAEPLFFLDYIATGKISQETLLQVVKGMSAGCREAGCSLIGGETAEMPDFYAAGEYDLAGFAVGIVDDRRRLTGRNIQRGDQVIGIASSGLHSNGYSLVRKVFFDAAGWKIDRYVEEFGCTVGEELLKPTRIYAAAIKKIIGRYKRKKMIRAIAHITGGGFPGNIPRILPQNSAVRIVRNTWPVPPVFSVIQQLGSIADDEMFRVFNMGIGMVMIVSPMSVDTVTRRLAKLGHESYVIGEVVPGGKNVIIE